MLGDTIVIEKSSAELGRGFRIKVLTSDVKCDFDDACHNDETVKK